MACSLLSSLEHSSPNKHSISSPHRVSSSFRFLTGSPVFLLLSTWGHRFCYWKFLESSFNDGLQWKDSYPHTEGKLIIFSYSVSRAFIEFQTYRGKNRTRKSHTLYPDTPVIDVRVDYYWSSSWKHMEKAWTRYDFFPIPKFYILLGLLLLSLVFVYLHWAVFNGVSFETLRAVLVRTW